MILNQHSVVYLLLGLLSLLLIAFTYYKNKRENALILLLGMIGLSHIIEFVILVLFDSYTYIPLIILHNPYYDSVMGALFSNSFALPATAMFIAVFQLSGVWVILFAGLFTCIEWLFVQLNVYEHHWWKYGYTTLGLLTYFGVAKAWYRYLQYPLRFGHQFLTLFLCLTGAVLMLEGLPMILFESRFYEVDWFEHRSRNTIALFSILSFNASLIFTYFLSYQNSFSYRKYAAEPPQWLMYGLPLTLVLSIQLILFLTGIYQINSWWDPLCMFAANLFVLLMGRLILIKLDHTRYKYDKLRF